jgi:hypothetical protein
MSLFTLFRKRPMQEREVIATAALTEQELTARLAAVAAQIAAGTGDVVLALEEQERLTRQIKAAQIQRATATDRANREAQAAKVAAFDERVNKTMVELNTHVSQLLFVLQDYDALVAEAYKGAGNGRSFPEIFSGLDHEFATKLRAAIFALAPVEWDFDAALPGGKGGRPTPRIIGLRKPRFSETDALGRAIGTRYL